MDNPMTAIGDIIYGSTVVGGEATPTALAKNPNPTNRFLRSKSNENGGLPSWEPVPIQNTVVSFVVDGYGGPLTGSTPTAVFIATIPFAATYTNFTIQGDAAPGSGNSVTLAVGSKSAVITTSNSATGTGADITFLTSGTLTFTLTVTGPTVATTKLFVNLTGTRS